MIRYHRDLQQGTDEWRAARCGLLTASEMKLIVNVPKPETRIKKNGEPYKQREPSSAEDQASRTHLYELLAQRITRHVPPSFQSFDMIRGKEDECDARILYGQKYAPVEECGFVTNDRWGFTLGWSPDGLVGSDGFIEAKSRLPKYQIETIIKQEMPTDYVMQVQTALLVSERKWCDFISYCGGLPMTTIRVYPDAKIQRAILDAAAAFEERLAENLAGFHAALGSGARLIPTERRIEEEMLA